MQNSWKGRLIGALIGIFLGGPVGALIGFAVGYYVYDKKVNQQLQSFQSASNNYHNASYNYELIRATFALMGYVARGAGRINESHIQKSTQIMEVMGLDATARQIAIAAFNQGKDENFVLEPVLRQVRQITSGNLNTISILLEIQVQIALSDGMLETLERQRLLQIAAGMGVDTTTMEHLIEQRLNEIKFSQGYQRQSSNQDYSQHSYSHTDTKQLEEAYKMLGVSQEDSFEEIKKAHRRMMNKYHPDKLASQGLPPQMAKMYEEKAKDIQSAFDLIKEHLGQ